MKTKTLSMHPTPIDDNGYRPGMFEILEWKITAFGGKLRDVHILGIREKYINLSQLEEITANFNVKLHQIGNLLEVIVAGREQAVTITTHLNQYAPHIGITKYDKEIPDITYRRLLVAISEAEEKKQSLFFYDESNFEDN